MTDKQALLEKYRYINVEDNHWYTELVNEFKNELKTAYNAEISDVQFSGFCSQGDGASLYALISDPTRILGIITGEYPMLRKQIEKHSSHIVVYRRHSTYVHSNTMGCDVAVEEFSSNDMGKDEFYDLVADKWNEILFSEATKLEDEILKLMRGEADRLYQVLEKEHDYLTSDEIVWKTIEANGLYNEGEE